MYPQLRLLRGGRGVEVREAECDVADPWGTVGPDLDAHLPNHVVAGARGEVTARVFCQEFHAELISIAGVFRVFETLPPELAGKPVQAWLDGDDLRFARIGG